MANLTVELSKIISESVATLESVCKQKIYLFLVSTNHLRLRLKPSAPTTRRQKLQIRPRQPSSSPRLCFHPLLPSTVSYLGYNHHTLIFSHSDVAFQHVKSAALRVCSEANVTEILVREAGPNVRIHSSSLIFCSNDVSV